jgi:hypothetical protein
MPGKDQVAIDRIDRNDPKWIEARNILKDSLEAVLPVTDILAKARKKMSEEKTKVIDEKEDS